TPSLAPAREAYRRPPAGARIARCIWAFCHRKEAMHVDPAPSGSTFWHEPPRCAAFPRFERGANSSELRRIAGADTERSDPNETEADLARDAREPRRARGGARPRVPREPGPRRGGAAAREKGRRYRRPDAPRHDFPHRVDDEGHHGRRRAGARRGGEA